MKCAFFDEHSDFNLKMNKCLNCTDRPTYEIKVLLDYLKKPKAKEGMFFVASTIHKAGVADLTGLCVETAIPL